MSHVKEVFYKVVGPYKTPNYPHALSHTVCGDHKQTDFFRKAIMYFVLNAFVVCELLRVLLPFWGIL